jgi:molecular chaperone DnaK
MAEIRSAQEELTKVYSEAGSSLYAQGAQQGSTEAPGSGPTAGAQPGATTGADDVVEADYEIVDDKK